MSWVNSIVVPYAFPKEEVVHSPTPSTLRIAASSKGDVKKVWAA